MELKVDSERVVKAASKCSSAKEVLKELFPEAFTSRIDLSKLLYKPAESSDGLFSRESQLAACGNSCLIAVRNSGQFRGKAFYLNTSSFDWKLQQDPDSYSTTILIPTPKTN